MMKINKRKAAIGLVSLMLFTGSVHARLFIDYEGVSPDSLKKEDPLVPVAKNGDQKPAAIPENKKPAAKPEKISSSAARTMPVSDQATPVTEVVDSQQAKAGADKKADAPVNQVVAMPTSSKGVVSVGSPYNINRTSSGGSLKIEEAMILVTPNGWTSSFHGKLTEAPRVSWDVKNAGLQDVLTQIHNKTGIGFVIDWSKKNIEVHGT